MLPLEGLSAPAPLPDAAGVGVPIAARNRLIATADRLMQGRWRIFEVEVENLGPEWDWFLDPRTGVRAPADRFAATIDHRNPAVVGNIKHVWELSRHHHLTVLSAAYFLTEEARYAERVREQLRSWWRMNPFLTGIHWTSGIEIGMRLIAWTWVRRLLEGWPHARDLFEENPAFRRQLIDHQKYLARIQSCGSSANNHLIAELSGLFVSTCAFPFADHAALWRDRAASALCWEIQRQTFPDGINRELAADYHGYVLELLLAAALEGEASGYPLGSEAWTTIRSMMDALAAIVDCTNRPPRQGDSDEAHGLLLDPPAYNRWKDLLVTGTRLFGPLAWWPDVEPESVRSSLWTTMVRPPQLPGGRPVARPHLFPHAGFAILRTGLGEDEIWCVCDHGPLGFLSTAAHGHADALSIELRIGGVELLADPGTYCYHGEPIWRSYFRSTRAHNTLELAGMDQSTPGGSFLWLRHARAWLMEASGLSGGKRARWQAAHAGYSLLKPPAIHERTIELNREARYLVIHDVVRSEGDHDGRLIFHLGPGIRADLEDDKAVLGWNRDEKGKRAVLTLPQELSWITVQGDGESPAGWYSERFGKKEPTTSLMGRGIFGGGRRFTTRLQF